MFYIFKFPAQFLYCWERLNRQFMKNLILVAALAVVCLTSCQKQISSLPEQTQTGANTFGAKIDGSLWGPIGFGIVPTAPILEARFGGNNSIFINARNFGAEPTETEMELYLQNVQKPGMIYLNQNTSYYPSQSASYGYFIKRKVTPLDTWMTNSTLGGWVNISKLDIENKVISGTFEFQAQGQNGSPNISVTEGRFDVKIQ